MDITDRFGPALREARMDRGMTQEDLAHAASLHRTEISLLERNQRTPVLETIIQLCRGLGLTAGELLFMVEDHDW